MTKKIKYILWSVILFSNILYCSKNPSNTPKQLISLTETERVFLDTHTTITAHNETYWAPFNFNINNKPMGFSIDYIKLLTSKLGISVKFISGYSWSEYMKMLQEDKLDTIINIAYTKERAKSIEFTKPFYTIQNAIYVNKANPNFNSLEDLKGHTIASVKDFFTQQELAKDIPEIKQKLVENQLDTIKLLSLGKVDAIIAEKAIADYIIQNNGISNIMPTNFVKDSKYLAQLRIGTSKKNRVLKNILNKAQKLITTQEMNALKQKWFGVDIGQKNSFTAKEKHYLNNKKIIKVCTNPNWTPIEFTENNKPQGISIDNLEIVAKDTQLTLKYIITSSWSQSQEFLKQKKCDILPAAIRTKKRETYANFTEPYLKYDLAIITKNDKPLVTNIESIIYKTMSRKKGSGLIAKLKSKYPKISIKETYGYQDAISDVSDGNVYFTITTLPVFSYYKNKSNLTNLQVAGYSKMKYNLSIAVRKDDITLLNILNKALNKIDLSTQTLIFEKWTKKQVRFQADYRLLWQLAIVSLIIIIIILFFILKQKRLNMKIQQLNIELEERVKKAIKETQKKEQLLRQQSRFAQMGEMISMIAHQWRQPLAAISSTSATINLKTKLNKLDKDTALELSSKISSYSQHLSSTINDFREFFRENKEKKETTYNELIESVLGIIETSIINKNIVLNKSLNSNSIFNTYPNELKQVILNLIKNAEDILLEKEIENPEINIKTHDNLLIISDNAGGIPKDIIDKIFDPYFSTKINKDGTGLGLYMSKTIIEEHCNGSLSVVNNGYGAEFTIVLKGLK